VDKASLAGRSPAWLLVLAMPRQLHLHSSIRDFIAQRFFDLRSSSIGLGVISQQLVSLCLKVQ
jgi:hypothetical protein